MSLHRSGLFSAADNQVVLEITNVLGLGTWQFGSLAGAMDVYQSPDGIDYFPTYLAIVDLASTAPSTSVIETVAGGNYGIKGQFYALRFLQKGATSVTGGYVTGY